MNPFLATTALILTLLTPLAHASAYIQRDADGEEWISLYLGKEAGFQTELNERIRELCRVYGVPFRTTDTHLILVPKEVRTSVLNLISGHYQK